MKNMVQKYWHILNRCVNFLVKPTLCIWQCTLYNRGGQSFTWAERIICHQCAQQQGKRLKSFLRRKENCVWSLCDPIAQWRPNDPCVILLRHKRFSYSSTLKKAYNNIFKNLKHKMILWDIKITLLIKRSIHTSINLWVMSIIILLRQ